MISITLQYERERYYQFRLQESRMLLSQIDESIMIEHIIAIATSTNLRCYYNTYVVTLECIVNFYAISFRTQMNENTSRWFKIIESSNFLIYLYVISIEKKLKNILIFSAHSVQYRIVVSIFDNLHIENYNYSVQCRIVVSIFDNSHIVRIFDDFYIENSIFDFSSRRIDWSKCRRKIHIDRQFIIDASNQTFNNSSAFIRYITLTRLRKILVEREVNENSQLFSSVACQLNDSMKSMLKSRENIRWIFNVNCIQFVVFSN